MQVADIEDETRDVGHVQHNASIKKCDKLMGVGSTKIKFYSLKKYEL